MKKNNGFVKLPDSELKVMQIIWDMYAPDKKIDAGSMINAYPDEIGHLKLTTVLTLISRLNQKGFVKTEKQGRVNYYIPLVREDVYKREATAEFVEHVHKSSPVSLISALFDMGAISKDDIDQFRAQILNSDDSEK